MELLLSLQSAEELRIAAEFPWSWLDLKNPSAGSLGCPSESTAVEFLDAASTVLPRQSLKLSIAIGELLELSNLGPDGTFVAPIEPTILNQFDFIKVALASTDDAVLNRMWVRLASSLCHQLDSPAKLILVHYADCHLANAVGWDETVRVSETLGCEYILVDTFDKAKGSLLKWRSPQELREFGSDARRRGLKLSLAGSLRMEDFEALNETHASILGIRGAACQEGSRVSTLCRDRLQVLSNHYSNKDSNCVFLR